MDGGQEGGKRRTNAEIAAVREAAREELAAHHPMTLRQVHYRLVSRDDVVHPNTLNAYDTLGGWLRDDRLAGVVPWEWMVDRLRRASRRSMWNSPADFVRDQLDGYHREVWLGQVQYVEVWCEKDALSGIFTSVLSRYGVTLNVGRGYDGWSSIKLAANRIKDRVGKYGLDEATVLYFGDFDPSGEDMHRSLQERFAMLGFYPDMPKVALTHADARRLPGDVVKANDSRGPAFVDKYGDLAVELDALPVEELTTRIRSSVERYIDMDALAENERIQAKQDERVRELADEMAERLERGGEE